MIKKVCLSCCFCFFLYTIHAQVAINEDGSNPDASAILDVKSADKGMLIPRMDSASKNAISNPAIGLLVYDTDTQTFWYYDNSQWNEIGTAQAALVPEYENPSVLSITSLGSENRFMVLEDNILYIADDGPSKLRAVDVSDVANPTILSEIDYSGNGIHSTNGIAIKDNFIYIPYFIPGNGGGIVIVDISNPNLMTYTDIYNVNYSYSSCFREGNTLYIMNSITGELILYDITNAANPVITASIAGFYYGTTSGGSYIDQGSVYVENNIAYIHHTNPNASGGIISVVDLSDIQNLSIVGMVAVDTDAVDDIEVITLKKYQNYLFLSTSDVVGQRGRIIDVSDPTNPFVTGQLMHQSTAYATAFDVASNFLYTIDYSSPESISVQDLTTPINQQLVFSQALPTSQYGEVAQSVIVDKNIAYFLLYEGLLIYKLGTDYTTVTYHDGTTGLEPLDVQELSLSNNTLSISNVTNAVDLSGYLDNTDDQTIDVFSLSGDNLQLSLEDDGQSTQTVDLSSFKDNTDDQTIDVFSLSGDNLQLSLEDDGQSTQTVDLSSFKDNTDDQTIDVFSLSGDNLQLSLEDDGQSTQTVDLSSFKDNTDDQTIDVFSLSGDNLQLSLESDGQGTQTVSLSSLKDNLGNHTATQNIQLNSNWLSNDGGNEGLRIDNNGQVGIGISSPNALLDLSDGSGNNDVLLRFNTERSWQFEEQGSGANTNLVLKSSSTGKNFNMLSSDGSTIASFRAIDGNGSKVGINKIIGSNDNTLEVNGNASKSTAGDWLANSDARLKKNIEPLESQVILNKLLDLQGVTYEWNDDKTGNERPEGLQYGFTAQNIQAVFPTLVTEDSKGYLQTAYGTYDAMYVEALRALNDENVALKEKVEELETQVSKIQQLEQQNAEMKAMLEQMQAQLNSQNQ